ARSASGGRTPRSYSKLCRERPPWRSATSTVGLAGTPRRAFPTELEVVHVRNDREATGDARGARRRHTRVCGRAPVPRAGGGHAAKPADRRPGGRLARLRGFSVSAGEALRRRVPRGRLLRHVLPLGDPRRHAEAGGGG